MRNLPASLQSLFLTAFYIHSTDRDPTVKRIEVKSCRGTAQFLVTRQQLLDLADHFAKAAATMAKPS